MAERFWSKVDKNGPIPANRPELGPCWLWMGNRLPTGYGLFRVHSTDTTGYAHRWAWESVNGPMPDGLETDHLCFNPPCVNFTHLEAVTPIENLRRSRRVEKTHCINGHPYTPENTYQNGRGRFCRTCLKQHSKKWETKPDVAARRKAERTARRHR